jgi:periplasmic protein TonB
MIREPRKVVDVAAVYPEIARAARVEGLVILEATIDERGLVTDARVLRSVPLLDAAALAALKQWRYTPTLLNGTPVRVLMTVTFRFSLGNREL